MDKEGIGRSVEAATARIRPTIADEHYLQGEEVCETAAYLKKDPADTA